MSKKRLPWTPSEHVRGTPAETELAYLTACHPRAIEGLVWRLLEQQRELLDLAAERVTTVGLEYGGAALQASDEELEQALSEELADAIFYASVLRARHGMRELHQQLTDSYNEGQGGFDGQ